MHVYLALAALTLIQSLHSVSGAPLTATPISSIGTAENKYQRSSDQALTLLSSSLNNTSTAPRPFPNTASPSNETNTTPIALQAAIPYRVRGSSTSLLFHAFGPKIPPGYLLQCLSVSLTVVLEKTLDGKGKELIASGFFTHTHILPNDDKVTIIVADFRESGRPMTYYDLRDVLTGIGEFMTEPDQEVRALTYEVDVDGKGYVGTGHVDYEPVGSK